MELNCLANLLAPFAYTLVTLSAFGWQTSFDNRNGLLEEAPVYFSLKICLPEIAAAHKSSLGLPWRLYQLVPGKPEWFG